MSYTLPERVVTNIGASRATLTVSGRNLWTIWQATEDIFGREVLPLLQDTHPLVLEEPIAAT